MKPEHDARFRRIAEDFLERPGGDYAELLRRGRVSSPEGVDPEEWRAEIRAKARADKIRVITMRDGDRAIAARHRKIPEDQELEELSREFNARRFCGVCPSGRGRWGTRSTDGCATTSRASPSARGVGTGSTPGLTLRRR